MLTIAGPKTRYCDAIERRSFLRIGGLALGGMSLPGILRAEQAAGIHSSDKAIIMILLPGGPPHLDMYDLKPEAPAEYPSYPGSNPTITDPSESTGEPPDGSRRGWWQRLIE